MSHPNKISGTREIDGLKIKFIARQLPSNIWEIMVTDHVGESTREICNPGEEWATIISLTVAAVTASREAIAEVEAG